MRAARLPISLLALALLAFAVPVSAQQGTTSPHGTLPAALDCTACHLPTAWKPLKSEIDFDHSGTGFPLSGRHAEVVCATCHLGLRFDEPDAGAADCASCHVDIHQGALGQDCARCHAMTSFKDLSPVGLHARTSFPLTGSHLQIACESCHMDEKGGAFSALPTECVACHRQDYESAESVDHEAEGFATTCEDCHATLSWASTGGFDHLARSGFALLGRHDALRCEACHVLPGNELRFPPPAEQQDCVACHQADYDREHAGSGFATTCADCHTVDGWEGASFDHAATGFALLGRHAPLACEACHLQPGNELRFPVPGGQEDCVACHRADYDEEHTGSGFATTCADCHTVDTWEDAEFDHAATGFALLGRHAPLECEACHVHPGNQLRFPAPSAQGDCVACHRADYDEEHAGSGFATTCTDCHTVDTWEGATFDHAATGFALLGLHEPLACEACHIEPGHQLKFPAPSGQGDCVACHRADYDEEHAGSGFSTTCADCHTVDGWDVANFDHTATGFALLGSHAPLTCATCHVEPGNELRFPAPSSQEDCVACHRAQYDQQHAGSGFATTCADCHTVDTWQGAVFDHGSTGFDLVGAHSPLDCAACHVQPGNQLKFPAPSSQEDCVACHQTDYDGEHAGSGFPTTCADCHTVDTWQGAVFDHGSTGFDLVGAHTPLQCSACHIQPGNQLRFPAPSSQEDCVACHQADYNQEHAGTGFPTTCTDCHTIDTWEGAVFDHGSTGFDLVGAHTPLQCSACHIQPGNQLRFPAPSSQEDCVACHLTDYNQEHAGSGFPTTCLTCHDVGSWDATFDHDAQFFPIFSGPHDNKWDTCQTCHGNAGDFSVFTCLTCHEHNRAEMDDKHREVGGYAYDSARCYDCHPDGRGDD